MIIIKDDFKLTILIIAPNEGLECLIKFFSVNLKENAASIF